MKKLVFIIVNSVFLMLFLFVISYNSQIKDRKEKFSSQKEKITKLKKPSKLIDTEKEEDIYTKVLEKYEKAKVEIRDVYLKFVIESMEKIREEIPKDFFLADVSDILDPQLMMDYREISTHPLTKKFNDYYVDAALKRYDLRRSKKTLEISQSKIDLIEKIRELNSPYELFENNPVETFLVGEEAFKLAKEFPQDSIEEIKQRTRIKMKNKLKREITKKIDIERIQYSMLSSEELEDYHAMLERNMALDTNKRFWELARKLGEFATNSALWFRLDNP